MAREILATKQDILYGRAGFFLMKPYVHFQEDVGFASDSPTWRLKKKAFATSMKL